MKVNASPQTSKKKLKLKPRKLKFIKPTSILQPKLKSQALEVLAALKQSDRTTIEIINDYHILGVAARISELRKYYKIHTTLLSSGMASYHLEGKVDE